MHKVRKEGKRKGKGGKAGKTDDVHLNPSAREQIAAELL